MLVNNVSLKINLNNNEQLKFVYSYNKFTKYQDLLEYISFLYPEYNICPCFCFSNNSYYLNNDTLIISNNDINGFLKLSNDFGCKCSEIKKKFYRKRKVYIIDNFEEEFKKLKNNENIINPDNKKDKKIKKDKKDNYDIEMKLKNEKNKLQSQINELENQITLLREENQKLKNKNKELEIDKNEKANIIMKLQNDINSLEMAVDNINPRKDGIKINPLNNQLIGNKYVANTNFEDFYDVIIDIKSVKDINKGWDIKMSPKGLQKYKEFKEQKILKIGVIGNSNKGKSFLLSKISKINLPSSTSIRTEGLSIKYPELEKFVGRKIALLDSAGLETPVLKNKDDNILKTNLKNNAKEIFKEKSREKLITELFLQNFIINNSDILIIVVGILTYSEQKLLNRISNEFKKAKDKNKPLFIIHNLITYTSIEQVKNYIKQFLLESATFDLEKGHNINTKTQQVEGEYYFEVNNFGLKIYHLIFANETSEAGTYYNNFTLEFLEKSYIGVTDLKPFDVIENLKQKFIDISREIIEQKENQKPLEMKDFCKDENPKSIKLNNVKDITLKKCLIDELGFSNLKSNGFEPNYSYYKDSQEQGVEKIIVKLEAPGNSSVRSDIDYVGEYTIIRLKGNKKKDKLPEKVEDNLYNNRELGEFSLDIPLKTEDYLINSQIAPKIVEKKGLLIIEYQLLPKKSEEQNIYAPAPDDEI